MTKKQAAKHLGILHDRSQWRSAQNADERELLMDLGWMRLQSAATIQEAINKGFWVDVNGNLHITSAAEKSAGPQIVLRLVEDADAYFTMAGK